MPGVGRADSTVGIARNEAITAWGLATHNFSVGDETLHRELGRRSRAPCAAGCMTGPHQASEGLKLKVTPSMSLSGW